MQALCKLGGQGSCDQSSGSLPEPGAVLGGCELKGKGPSQEHPWECGGGEEGSSAHHPLPPHPTAKKSNLLSVFYGGWGGRGVGVLGSALGLLLSLHSGINPGRLRRPYGMPGMELGLAVDKARTLASILTKATVPAVLFKSFF